MRLIPTNLLENLRRLATLAPATDATDFDREMGTLTATTAQQILDLPDVIQHDYTDELTFIRGENTRLEADVRRLQATIDRLLAMPADNNENDRPRRNEKMPDIPMFDGTRAKLQPWIDQLWLKLSDEGRYATLQSKLVYAFSRCEGDALNHLRPYRQAGTLNFASIQTLIDVLEAAFEDPDRQGTARRTLLTLRQDNDEFPAFYAKFQAQVPHAGMDDGGLLAAMTEAVNPRIRDRMIGIYPKPNTMAAYVQMARQIDADFRAEKGRKAGIAHVSQPACPRAPPRTPTTTTATGTEPGPMDLSHMAGKNRQFPFLSEQERARRLKTGSCFRCGGQGHMSSACPPGQSRTVNRVAAISATDLGEDSSATATQPSEN